MTYSKLLGSSLVAIPLLVACGGPDAKSSSANAEAAAPSIFVEHCYEDVKTLSLEQSARRVGAIQRIVAKHVGEQTSDIVIEHVKEQALEDADYLLAAMRVRGTPKTALIKHTTANYEVYALGDTTEEARFEALYTDSCDGFADGTANRTAVLEAALQKLGAEANNKVLRVAELHASSGYVLLIGELLPLEGSALPADAQNFVMLMQHEGDAWRAQSYAFFDPESDVPCIDMGFAPREMEPASCLGAGTLSNP